MFHFFRYFREYWVLQKLETTLFAIGKDRNPKLRAEEHRRYSLDFGKNNTQVIFSFSARELPFSTLLMFIA